MGAVGSSAGGAGAAERFTFGVVTDVQHADVEDGASFHGRPRYYRHALTSLRRTVDAWVARPAGRRLAFAVHLGDIIDGLNAERGPGTEHALNSVLAEFGRLDAAGSPTRHLLGNHCLYNLERSQLHHRLGFPRCATGTGASYYSFAHDGFRFVMMDPYDLSILGWEPGHRNRAIAEAFLAERNPNDNKNSPEGLDGLDRRFVAFGGGVSDEQLAWLDGELAEAERAGERVIAFSHLPFHPASAPPVCLIWNYEAVLERLQAARCVVATFAGHTHKDDHHVDEHGIHHRVVGAVLEAPPGTDAYGDVEVYDDRLVLRGAGVVASTEMRFREASAPVAAAAL